MTGLLRRREFLTERALRPSYDVVIVGGGVNGLSLAFHLAEYHGIRDVAVLERAYIGSGGSGRNTQVVRATYNTTETVPLYATSLGMYRTLSRELDFNVLFSTQGNLDPPWRSQGLGRHRSVQKLRYPRYHLLQRRPQTRGRDSRRQPRCRRYSRRVHPRR
jgi:glycine/D-amino acid oxidase-like deaminating enzyme